MIQLTARHYEVLSRWRPVAALRWIITRLSLRTHWPQRAEIPNPGLKCAHKVRFRTKGDA